MVLFALTIVLASCAGSGPSASVGSRPQATAAGPAPSSTAHEPTQPAPTGTGASAAPGSTSTAPRNPAATPVPTVTPVPSPESAFTLLKMATGADTSKPAPGARTFTSTFPAKAPAMYVVFALRTGLTGNVICAISANGAQAVQPITLTYGPTNSWGDFKISSQGTFVVGNYRATLTFGPTGEVAMIDFTVQ